MVGFFEKNASKDAVSQKFLDESENAGIIKYLEDLIISKKHY